MSSQTTVPVFRQKDAAGYSSYGRDRRKKESHHGCNVTAPVAPSTPT